MVGMSLKPLASKIVAVLGVICCITGAVIYGLFPSIVKSKVEEKLILREGSIVYNNWITPAVPYYLKLHLFNVTNPTEVAIQGRKPILKETGPYTYREHKIKHVTGWNKETGTVTYKEVTSYVFEPELSGGSEDDLIIAVNMPLVVIARLANDRIPSLLKPALMPVVNGILAAFREELFVRRTAKELLFQGYEVNLVSQLTSVIKPFIPFLPEILPNSTFGLLYGKNNTDEGLTTVYTGEKDMSNYLYLRSWKNRTSLSTWRNRYCDMLNGTDGKGFPPSISRTDELQVFVPDICRSINLQYERDVIVKGITAYRYILPESVFSDTSSNPDNRCFNRGRNFQGANGVIPISACQKGKPVYVSLPHFYRTDERIQRMVSGLNPEKEKHQTFIDVEPTIGTTVNGARRAQINIEITRDSRITALQSIPNLLFPVFWLEESAHITESAASLFTAQVKTPMIVGTSVLLFVIVLGAVWILVGTLLALWQAWQKRAKMLKTNNVFPETIIKSLPVNEPVIETKNTLLPSLKKSQKEVIFYDNIVHNIQEMEDSPKTSENARSNTNRK